MTHPPTSLETEITTIQSQINHLSRRRAHLRTHILSHPSFPSHLSSSNPTVLALACRERHQDLKQTYRRVLGVTSFPLQDTRHGAGDEGKLLGVRIDGGRRVYFLFLKQEDERAWRVVRSTVPRWCGGGAGLVGRVVEVNAEEGGSEDHGGRDGGKRGDIEYDLTRLVRETRSEILAFHKRKDAISGLRKELGEIVGIEIVDEEARNFRMEWEDGRVVRVRMGTDGGLETVMCEGFEGRGREMERVLMPREGRIEGLGERLRVGMR